MTYDTLKRTKIIEKMVCPNYNKANDRANDKYGLEGKMRFNYIIQICYLQFLSC
jgi:hypothetical protein